MGKKREFYEGQAVSEASSYMKFSYLIVDGKIGIWKNNIQLVTYGSRTFLGETFLFGKNFQSVRLVSANKSTLLRFSRSATLKFFRKKPEKLFNIFTRNIIRTQQNKLGQLTTQMYRFKKRLLDNPPPR
ncbi:MAG TPA: cyclic nucleotide-binding domain-containing protein [Balneolaceae bacterium]|nr:cyclic nucleotide-binding domain-containing protein [Balneolaceae bacterium]